MVQLPKKIRLPEDAYGNTEAVFHVVIRAAIGSAPFEDPDLAQQIWALITDEREREDIDLLAACLMPDHAHFLLKPAGRSVLEWANAFKSYSTRMSWQFRKAPALWQPSFFDRRIRDEDELSAAHNYILSNPVEAGLAATEEEWPWSASWIAN